MSHTYDAIEAACLVAEVGYQPMCHISSVVALRGPEFSHKWIEIEPK